MPDLMPPGFMVGNSFFNNFGAPTTGTRTGTGTPSPSAFRPPTPVLPSLQPGQTGTASTAISASTGQTAQTGTRRAVVPGDWLGTANAGMEELLREYGRAGDAFDTTEFDA